MTRWTKYIPAPIKRVSRGLVQRLPDRVVREVAAEALNRERLSGMIEAPARLHDLWMQASTWTSDPIVAIRQITGQDPTATHLAEFDQAAAALENVMASSPGRYPPYFVVGRNTALVEFLIVRLLKPAIVVETGVADGFSTAVMIDAMYRNGCGILHSIEVSADVGSLIDATKAAAHWKLHVTDGSLAAVERVLAEVGPGDVFIHDGDHSYAHQLGEYRLAAKYVRAGGLVMTDDADWSRAWHTWCNEAEVRPVDLFDERKVFGAALLPG